MRAKLYNITLAAEAKKDLRQIIEERLQYVQESNLKFSSSVELELTLYEVTKELSRFIEEADIVKTFNEKARGLFNFADCKVIEAKELKDYRERSYNSFRININTQGAKYFLVKGLSQGDRVRIGILVNQLELFLRRAKLYADIQKLSITDGLTQAYVRGYFMERLKQECARSKYNNLALSLLLIDVDNFKAINDTYGHISADALLRETVKVMVSGLRQIDMCARYGGEEFCIMLPQTDKEGACLAAERLRLAVEKTEFNIFNERLACTISIGVATFPADAKGVNALIAKADKALYKAKTQGKNRVCAAGIK
jgi:diguanylate cyclase (GGDEF)-like protein